MRIPWQMLYSQVLVWKALGGARYTCGGCRGCQAAPCTLHIGCCNFRLGIDLLSLDRSITMTSDKIYTHDYQYLFQFA
ncbi:uncharacterized protein BKA55DRAFT_566183 [Fusarium redolens]|uniref:Secreted protein n=1 Tax=Fusarium redolens TaxID=48865 RepID=A0A9P9K8Z4_FUSRE|nr:uncharacterized protein BKA55DRAFT_566183 [Fusarium redolens]KAH7253752.1 hypothetical protein BKA55DRAFT_566183 [Fusarium redolens]